MNQTVNMMKINPIHILVAGMLVLGLSACESMSVGNALPDKKVDYKKSRQASGNLEIPRISPATQSRKVVSILVDRARQ